MSGVSVFRRYKRANDGHTFNPTKIVKCYIYYMILLIWLIGTNIIWAALYIYEVRKSAKDKKDMIKGYEYMFMQMRKSFQIEIDHIKKQLKDINNEVF